MKDRILLSLYAICGVFKLLRIYRLKLMSFIQKIPDPQIKKSIKNGKVMNNKQLKMFKFSMHKVL